MLYSCGQAIASPVALLGSSIGAGELFLVFLVALLLFGPKRLPEIARMLGKAANELRRAAHEFEDQVMRIDDSHSVPTEKKDDSADKDTAGKKPDDEHRAG